MEGIHAAKIIVREYESSYGIEYFIGMENSELDILYGFCRLRLSENAGRVRAVKKNKLGGKHIVESMTKVAFPELLGCALIRELHVYGTMNVVDKNQDRTQHRGIGKALLKRAEEIAIENGYIKAAVISGVGVREYYRKRGYHLEETFMIKTLVEPSKPIGWVEWFKSFVV